MVFLKKVILLTLNVTQRASDFNTPMRTFKYNMAFVIVLISFYCPVAIGSPPLKAGNSAPSKASEPIRIDIKNKTESLSVEQILSPKKYLKRYLETAKKEGFPEKSPDREYQPIIVEKETPSIAGEKDAYPTVSTPGHPTTPVAREQSLIGEEKGTQTPTVDNRYLQSVSGREFPPPPPPPPVVKEKSIQEELPVSEGHQSMVTEKEISADNQITDAYQISTMSGSATTSAAERQSPADEEEDITQAYAEDNKTLPSLTERKPSSIVPVEERGYLEKSPTDEGNQPITSFSETLQQTKEESTPMTKATPELHSETIAGGEPLHLPAEAKGTQTPSVENKSHLTTDESGPPFTPAEESSYAATEGSSDVLNIEANGIQKGISSPEPPAETVKEAKDLKPTWVIWHTNPTLSIIIAVAITLIAAKIGGWLASMVMLPEVVGNLIVGIILGNFFFLTGSEFFSFLRTMPFLKMVAYFGTLLLLLTAGLHTDLRALLRVGASSFLVSLGGIIAPAGLGLIVGYFLLSDAAFSSKLLLAIIICNTSTGLLFAILSELKAMNTLEGRIITGATILTEIIVILTFGIASGIATKGEVSVMNVLVTAGIAFSFLAVVLIIVLKYGERFGNFLTSRVAEGLKISIVIILSLLFAFISGSIGLHGVIGAFAAGLLLRNVKFKDSDDKEYSNVERVIRPYYMILVPILFVRVGAQVDLKSILNMEAVLLGLAITGAAVIGKLFCSVCPIGKGINRMAIGIGMAMKLEGTLILSGIGRDMGILDDVVFSSIIMVIVFTSITCPSLLKASLVREKRRRCKNFHVTVDEKTKEIYIRFKNEVRG